MPCTCIAKVKAKLREKYGPTLDLPTIFLDIETGEATERLQPVIFYYRKNKADGSAGKAGRSGQLFHAYCPFCGRKYETEKKG